MEPHPRLKKSKINEQSIHGRFEEGDNEQQQRISNTPKSIKRATAIASCPSHYTEPNDELTNLIFFRVNVVRKQFQISTMAATASQTPNSILSESSESPSIDFLQLSSCEAYCDNLRAQLNADEEALIEERGSIINSQKELVRMGLCNMNNDLKKMTVKEFNATFGCDVIGTLRSQLKMSDGQGSEKKQVGIAAGLNLKTPAVKFAGRPPMTAARTVRKGERVV